VQGLLVDLLGRDVTVRDAGIIRLLEGSAGLVAAYANEADDIVVVCVADGAFANRSGAALSMVPATVADEAIDADVLDPNLVENTEEILNVLCRLLNSASVPHVKLAGVHALPGDVPPPVATAQRFPRSGRDLEVAIDGYGLGRLTILTR
jgi:hypothetical protein